MSVNKVSRCCVPQKKQKLWCSRIEGHNYTELDYGKNKAFCMLIEPGMFIDFSVIILKFNINNSFSLPALHFSHTCVVVDFNEEGFRCFFSSVIPGDGCTLDYVKQLVIKPMLFSELFQVFCH